MGISQAPTVVRDSGSVYPTTETHREEILQKHLMEYVSEIKNLKTSCEDYATQVTCLYETIDAQKKKIYNLEKLLKLYL